MAPSSLKIAISSSIDTTWAITHKAVISPGVSTSTTALLTIPTILRIIVLYIELILQCHPILPCLGVPFLTFEAVHRRVGLALELLEVHLEGRAQVHGCVHATRGDGHVELADGLACEKGATEGGATVGALGDSTRISLNCTFIYRGGFK